MQIFLLQTPVKDTIEAFVNKKITDGEIPPNQKLKFLDFEPSDGFLQDDLDGAIAVYAGTIPFSEGSGSDTEEQETESTLKVVAYGFGAPLKDLDDNLQSSVREAENRAKVLITCAFKSVMDRRVIRGAPAIDGNPAIPIAYGSGVNFGANRYPVSIEKFSPLGAMESKRGVCIFMATFKFRLLETAISESLGLPYSGSEDIKIDTYNPGSEPEGV